MPSREDRPLLAALAAIAFALYLNWSVSPLTPHGSPPKSNANHEQQWDTPLGHLWDWLAKDSISLFTGVLALLTGWLVYYNGKQIRLGRTEFIASHRPKIRVRTVFGPTPVEGGGNAFVVMIANVGESVARVIAFKVHAFDHTGREAIELQINENPIEYPLKIASGQAYKAVYSLKEYWGPLNELNRWGPVFCQGIISYLDDNEIARHTGFWRITLKAEHGNLDLSDRAKENEYED